MLHRQKSIWIQYVTLHVSESNGQALLTFLGLPIATAALVVVIFLSQCCQQQKFWIQYATYTHILCSICRKGALHYTSGSGLEKSDFFFIRPRTEWVQRKAISPLSHTVHKYHQWWGVPGLLWRCRPQMSAYSEKVFTIFHCICIVSGHFVDQAWYSHGENIPRTSFIHVNIPVNVCAHIVAVLYENVSNIIHIHTVLFIIIFAFIFIR